MKFFNNKIESKSDRRIFLVAIIAGYSWLSIVFFIRRIFAHYHVDLFLLGILPNFFAAIFLYLSLFLKTRSAVRSALISFALLAFAEMVQLFTPRTFDALDLIASIIGIGLAELIRRGVEKN